MGFDRPMLKRQVCRYTARGFAVRCIPVQSSSSKPLRGSMGGDRPMLKRQVFSAVPHSAPQRSSTRLDAPRHSARLCITSKPSSEGPWELTVPC